jgi:acyl-CoA thioester hydrolase
VKAPLVTYRGCVNAWECDHWGHQNTQFYLAKAADAYAALYCALGLTPSWLRDRGAAMIPVRSRVVFKRELRAGDAVSICSGVREAQGATLSSVNLLRNQEYHTASAVFESEARLTDLATRAPIELPANAFTRAAEFAAADESYPLLAPIIGPRAPAVTPQQAILTHRSTLGAWERDETGWTPPHFLIPRFSGAVTQLMAHLGLPRPVLLSRDIGYAALDCAFEYPVLLRPGQSLDIRSGVLEVGRKVLRIFHHVIDTENGGIATVMEVAVVFFDLTARKSVAMPEEIVACAGDLIWRGLHGAITDLGGASRPRL